MGRKTKGSYCGVSVGRFVCHNTGGDILNACWTCRIVVDSP